MALTKTTVGVTNIADLSSTPNATEGLTAAQLQAKFDKTGADLKTYINDTLTDELDTYFGNVSATEFGYLDGVTSAIQTQLNAICTNEAWTAPSLLNSWVNYEGGFQEAGYYKHNGRVYLRGLIKSGTITQSAFILPTGYRPAGTVIYAVLSNAAFGSVYIYADGNVVPNIGNNASVSLDGISFRVD